METQQEYVRHSRLQLKAGKADYIRTSEAYDYTIFEAADTRLEDQQVQINPVASATAHTDSQKLVGMYDFRKDDATITVHDMQSADSDFIALSQGYSVIIDEYVFRTSSGFDSGKPFTYELDLPGAVRLIGDATIVKAAFTSNFAVIKVLSTVYATVVSTFVPKIILQCTAGQLSGKWLDVVRRCTVSIKHQKISHHPRLAIEQSFEMLEIDET